MTDLWHCKKEGFGRIAPSLPFLRVARKSLEGASVPSPAPKSNPPDWRGVYMPVGLETCPARNGTNIVQALRKSNVFNRYRNGLCGLFCEDVI